MIDKLSLKICIDSNGKAKEEIQKFIQNVEDNTKINHFHLEISGQKSNSIGFYSDELFQEMWEKIKRLDLYNRIHLDISNLKTINDNWIKIISESIKQFNPREINFNFSNSDLSDDQFETLLNNSLGQMEIEKLHLMMENSNITEYKIKSIENIVATLKERKLNHVYINLKRNELKESKLINLNEIIANILIKEIYI